MNMGISNIKQGTLNAIFLSAKTRERNAKPEHGNVAWSEAENNLRGLAFSAPLR